MSFTPNTPTTGQTLGQTKFLIQNNFTVLAATIAVDHFDVMQSTKGKHNVIHFPTPLTTSPGTLANEIAVYSKSISGAPFLFFQPPGQVATGPDTQITTGLGPGAFTPTYSGSGASGTGYQTFTFGNIFMIFGTVFAANATQTVTFPASWAILYNVQLTRLATEASPPSTRSFHQAVSSTANSITFTNLNSSGTPAAGFNVYYQLLALG
jgi:hypothetical protein